jgi:hypothetical protein
MSAAARLLLQLEQRAVTAENLIVSLKNEVVIKHLVFKISSIYWRF